MVAAKWLAEYGITDPFASARRQTPLGRASFDALEAPPGAITMRTDHLRAMLGL
jgi:hypothetical protein